MSTETATTTAVATIATPLQRVLGLLERYSNLASKVAAINEAATSRIKPLKEAMEEVFTELQQVAKENRAELFGNTKTLGLDFGSIGFKLLDKKLICPEDLNQKWFMQMVQEAAPGAIDTKVNDKRLIMALAVLPDLLNVFKKRNIKIEQPETFYVTPKRLSKKQKIQEG
jgi:phage host-nuclease inhibitor protein Gam